eukprot:66654-Chlamydomonas_euryale.AAC.4
MRMQLGRTLRRSAHGHRPWRNRRRRRVRVARLPRESWFGTPRRRSDPALVSNAGPLCDTSPPAGIGEPARSQRERRPCLSSGGDDRPLGAVGRSHGRRAPGPAPPLLHTAASPSDAHPAAREAPRATQTPSTPPSRCASKDATIAGIGRPGRTDNPTRSHQPSLRLPRPPDQTRHIPPERPAPPRSAPAPRRAPRGVRPDGVAVAPSQPPCVTAFLAFAAQQSDDPPCARQRHLLRPHQPHLLRQHLLCPHQPHLLRQHLVSAHAHEGGSSGEGKQEALGRP